MAPQVVHMELTDRCNRGCDYCYVKRRDVEGSRSEIDHAELSTDDWRLIMDKLSAAGVFQVTFGGGEPSLRTDLFKLAEYCKLRAHMNLGMTTNGEIYTNPVAVPAAMRYFDQVNVSQHDSMMNTFIAIKNIDLWAKTGINYIVKNSDEKRLVTKDMVCSLYSSLAKSKKRVHAPPEVLLLSFKPIRVEDISDIPTSETVMKLANKLIALGATVAVDGFTRGICEGGYSFCDISSTGEVYPCSFVRESYGNILTEEFKDIWARMPRITKCPFKAKHNDE